MSNRRTPKNPSPLRAALAAKTSLRTYFDIAIEPTEKIEAAQRRLDVANQLIAATLLHDDDVRAKAEGAHVKAKAERDAHFHRIWFRGLQLDEFDALVALHPPTAEQAKDDWAWNPDTFNYALLEEAVVDGDLTAAEWEAELSSEKWTRADRNAFVNNCLQAQRQTMADAVPKD